MHARAKYDITRSIEANHTIESRTETLDLRLRSEFGLSGIPGRFICLACLLVSHLLCLRLRLFSFKSGGVCFLRLPLCKLELVSHGLQLGVY